MSSLLSFLSSASVEEVKPGTRTGGGGPRKQWQPNPGIVAIRLWRDGGVFPSAAAIEKFDLEYKDVTITKEALPLKEGETEVKHKNVYAFPNGTGNGFDVIDSRLWTQFKSGGDGGMLFIIPTPKDKAKVDLFGTANYDDDGKPKSTVADQGAKTFGKDVLVPAVEALYGIVFAVDAQEAAEGKPAVEAVEGVEYVDLAIVESIGDFNITTALSKPIMHLPKRVIRGKDAGAPTYVKRENSQVYGFAPASEVLTDYKPDAKKADEVPVVDNTKDLAEVLKQPAEQ